MQLQSRLILALLLCATFTACGSDETSESSDCGPNETLNPINGECTEDLRVIRRPDAGDEQDQGQAAPDMSADMDVIGPDLGCQTDSDDDGHLSMECGGDDCDDFDPYRSPSQIELCDAIDNNCNETVNDGITCSFFAHSDTTLYEIDPFAKTLVDRGFVPDLFDIDTHPDGTLYGITSSHLYRFDDATSQWEQFSSPLGQSVGVANGMAIDNEGDVWITSQNNLYSADLTTGRATLIGAMGGLFSSSGDCVITKSDALYMTSSHTPNDSLVFIDGTTGMASQVGVTGYDSIWALTSAWNTLYGLTAAGELIEIQKQTGASTLLHTFPNVSFYGAASTPGR